MNYMSDEGIALKEAFEEVIDVGREPRLAVHIDQLKSTGVANAEIAQRIQTRDCEADRQGVITPPGIAGGRLV